MTCFQTPINSQKLLSFQICFLFITVKNPGYSERNADVFKCLHLISFIGKLLCKSCCCNQSRITHMRYSCGFTIVADIQVNRGKKAKNCDSMIVRYKVLARGVQL